MPNTLGGETSPNRTSSPTYAALRSRAGKSWGEGEGEGEGEREGKSGAAD